MLVPLKISIAYPRSDSSLDSSKLSWGILHSEYGLSQSTDPSLFSNRRLSDKTTVVESKAEVQNKHYKTEQIKEGEKNSFTARNFKSWRYSLCLGASYSPIMKVFLNMLSISIYLWINTHEVILMYSESFMIILMCGGVKNHLAIYSFNMIPMDNI